LPLVVKDRQDQLLKQVSKELADAAVFVVVTGILNDVSRFAYVHSNLNSKLTAEWADRVFVESFVRNERRGIGFNPVPVGVLTSDDKLEGGDDMTLVVQDGVTCSFGSLSGGPNVVEEL
jgi:hypothetical protein